MDEQLVEKLKELALKYGVDFAKEAIVEIAFPALKLAVEKSDSKVDDVVLMALEAPLKAAVLELLEKVK
jgi:hypothetical protein